MSENTVGPTSQPLDIEGLSKLKTTDLEVLVLQLPSGREREQVLEVLVAKYRDMYSELAQQATETFIDKLSEKARDAVIGGAQKAATATDNAIDFIKKRWRSLQANPGRPADGKHNEGETPK